MNETAAIDRLESIGEEEDDHYHDPLLGDLPPNGVLSPSKTLVTLDPSLSKAVHAVHEILEQLTTKDSPPANDLATTTTTTDGKGIQTSEETDATNTRQSSPTEIGGTSSFETDNSSIGLAGFFQDFNIPPTSIVDDHDDDIDYSEPRHQPDCPHLTAATNRLGHSSLVSLCSWTLEQVEGEAPVLLSPLPPPAAVMSNNTSFSGSQSKNATRKGSFTSTGKSRRLFSFKKKTSDRDAEEKKDDGSTLTDSYPRLQMFGSEYARHLSKSQLAPPPCRSKAARRNFKFNKKSVAVQNKVRILEDADPTVLTGALLDIVVTYGDEAPPRGYHRLSQTACGQKIPMPRKKSVHFHVKKETNWDKAAQRPTITAIAIIFPDRQEFVPPGFCVVKNVADKQPANLMDSEDSERCYLVFRRSREGNPLTGLMPLVPPESVPAGYTVVERTPRNYVANLNASSKGPPLFLSYRQRLANLETLRPFPLVKSAQPKAGAAFLDDGEDDESSSNPAKLRAYYATGGTTVMSNVGRFHIMDRSTHSLLSPSSVANRLHLIQLSRSKQRQNEGCASSVDGDSISSRHESLDLSLSQDDREEIPAYILSHFLKKTLESKSDLFYPHDSGLRLCLEAMAFIPSVETAQRGEEKMRASQLLQSRSALLTPILTCCYNRHGGSALLAVDALHVLLTQTNFFADDVDLVEPDNESSTRLTLLDLAVQAVCDVATSSSAEASFGACVDFVSSAVRFSQGQLNTRTIGYVSRFYLFVFYFGASVPSSSSSKWPNPNWRVRKSIPTHGAFGDSFPEDDEDDLSLLFDPREDSAAGLTYLPGGAPQEAAISFKELISLSIVRLGKVAISELVTRAQPRAGGNKANADSAIDIGGFVEGLISGIVGDAVDHVERANFTQLAFYQVHRSGGSELFWHEMVNTCGMGLFGKDKGLGDAGRDIYIMVFAVLANLVKVALGKMRSKADRSVLLSRDAGSKLLSLELLLHFLEYWSDEQEAVQGAKVSAELGPPDKQSIETLAFSIRRMVVPCLLSNTRCGLEDPQVYSRMVKILTELWCSPLYRHRCKVELAYLIEHFALGMLQLGPQLIASRKLDLWSDRAHVSLLTQQVEVIKAMKIWFGNDPKDVIELFLNYDTDMCCDVAGPSQLVPGRQWKIFQRICSGLSNIAEQCGELVGEQIRENQTKIMSDEQKVGEELKKLIESMDYHDDKEVDKATVRSSALLLRKLSLEAISEIVKALAVSAASSTGSEFSTLLVSWCPGGTSESFDRSLSSVSAETSTSETRSVAVRKEGIETTPSGKLKAPVPHGEDDVLRFWRDAIAADMDDKLSRTAPNRQESLQVALEIARRKSLKKAIEYLIACNALSPSPRDIANFLRMNKESLDPAALGNYLSECGTGGIETEYWNSIRQVYFRAISFVGMEVEEGLRHFLTKCGFRLPGEAQRIDRIMAAFAKCYFEDNAGDTQRCPFKHEDTVFLLSFAIIMLNSDLHRGASGGSKLRKKMTKAEFVNNLKNAGREEDISKDYLLSLYDSIEENPIELHAESGDGSNNEGSALIQDMLSNVRTTDSLLRGLAVHDFHFATIDDFINGLDYSPHDALGDLTRSCVSKTWHQWHGVINTGLETAHLDPAGMEPSIEILLYALSLTVCLEMPTERAAFLNQLGRLKAFEERRQGRWLDSADNELYRDQDWYIELEANCRGSKERKLIALQTIHKSIANLKKAFQVDVQNKMSMTAVVRQIKGGEYLAQDPSRSFIRAEDLVKKSSRTGKSTTYRFFLFSDVLLYAKADSDGRFKIHEELPLHLLKIIDWFPPSQKLRDVMLEINHPRKSFFVICPSLEQRVSWVNQLKEAVGLEMDRKMKVEHARMAIYTTK